MGASRTLSCQTQYKPGVYGQYGAGGYFIDGCTVKLDLPGEHGPVPRPQCDIISYSFIDTNTYRGDRVTMNARIRRFDRGRQRLRVERQELRSG